MSEGKGISGVVVVGITCWRFRLCGIMSNFITGLNLNIDGLLLSA